MVGAGLHASGRTPPRHGPYFRATTSPTFPPTSASTTSGCPRRARLRPSLPAGTASRLSATGTTGSPDAGSSSGRIDEMLDHRAARLPVLSRVGQPDMERHLARRRRPDADRADLPRRRRRPAPFRTRPCRRSATSATSGRRKAAVLRLQARVVARARGVRRALAGAGRTVRLGSASTSSPKTAIFSDKDRSIRRRGKTGSTQASTFASPHRSAGGTR